MPDRILPFAEPKWESGLPRDPHTGDVFFSHRDPLGERRSVFLGHGGLDRLLQRPGRVVVGEVGWGSGLNCLLTVARFLRHAPPGSLLCYLGLEVRPWRAADLRRLWRRWPELARLGETILKDYPPPLEGIHRRALFSGRVQLLLGWGEAESLLRRWHAGSGVQLWYLDGFAPRLDPRPWSPRLMQLLAAHSAPRARVVTYSAAGQVRRALEAAGFALEKVPGFAGKRESCRGELRVPPPVLPPAPGLGRPPPPAGREAAVIGAGVAGAWMAQRLVSEGWEVHWLDAASMPASGASGNPRGLLTPVHLPAGTQVDPAVRVRALTTLHALHAWRRQGWRPEGLLQRLDSSAARSGLGLGEVLSARSAAGLAGVPLEGTWMHWPGAGSLDPRAEIARLVETHRCHTHFRFPVAALRRTEHGWSLLDGRGRLRLQVPVVILAAALDCARLLPALPLQAVRGQLALLAADAVSRSLAVPLCTRAGYLTPAHGGWHVLGASFEPGRESRRLDGTVHRDLLAALPRILPGRRRDGAGLRGRAGVRAVSPDRLPLVGPVPDAAAYARAYERLHQGLPPSRYPDPPYLPGLFVLSGLGSHGLAYAPWGADLIADLLTGVPLGADLGLVQRLHPARFLLRELRRPPLQRTMRAPIHTDAAPDKLR